MLKHSLTACAAGLLTYGAQAQDANTDYVPNEPLWELRLGGSLQYGPDYPAADDQSPNGVAAPILIYRGDKIRFGEYGVARAIAAETRRIQLDLSVDAVYSANSDGGAREGMPDLDYLLQIGPQLVVNLADTGWTENGRQQWKVLLPVRAVAATDFKSVEHAGIIAEPQIIYRRQYNSDLRQSWSVALFSTFTDSTLGEYWYEVPVAFATPDRAAYQADGGYLGTALRASWTRELNDNFQVFLTYQGRLTAGSANEDSPLYREDWTNAVSVSFVWKALKSKRAARNKDM